VDLKRGSFEQPAANVLEMQDSLVQQVASRIRSQLGQEIELRQQQAGTSNPQAWILVQRAEEARKRAEAALQRADGSAAAERAYAAADSIYALAHAADPKWPVPLTGRAEVAYQRSRVPAQDPVAATGWIAQGISLADTALRLNPQDPDALEARGTLRYWSWLLGLEPDQAAAQRLLQDAQSDLETATRVNPSQAGAFAILSHLYNYTGTAAKVVIAAQRAYEADAYLRDADKVLMRLFYATYETEQPVEAAHWCDVGRQRFPDEPDFLSCRLMVMTMASGKPDVALAWQLADSIPKLTPEAQKAFATLKARMAVAAVLARAGLADSARHVAERSHGDAEVDPTRDLSLFDAFVQTLLGDHDAAIEAFSVYLAANPSLRGGNSEDIGWWLRDLKGDPRFDALVGGS
jgi:tetratricopeptide (TPR) repeat protein